MNFLILLVAVATALVTFRRLGIFTIPSLGVVALFVYSIPAIFNTQIAFKYTGSIRYFIQADQYAVGLTLIVWIAFFLTLLLGLKLMPEDDGRSHAAAPEDYITATNIFVAASLAGLIYLIYFGGLFFFLAPRDEQLEDYITIIWRWTPVFGLGYAILAQNLLKQTFFLGVLTIIMLQGDRTVPVIAGGVFILLTMGRVRQQMWVAQLANIRVVVAVCVIASIVLFAKPLYVALKSDDLSILVDTFRSDRISAQIASLEPFATFNHLAMVPHMKLSITPGEFLSSVFGNFLIVPTVFGVETNLYNLEITRSLPYILTYGIAGNPWAHAYSVGGEVMIALIASAFAVTLLVCHKYQFNRYGRTRMLVVVLGALIAIYLHRNGVDNLFSFVRQVLIAGIIGGAFDWIISLSSRPRHAQQVPIR